MQAVRKPPGLGRKLCKPVACAPCARLDLVPAARVGRGRGDVLDRPDIEIKTGGWNNDQDMQAGGGPATQTESGSGGTDRLRATPPGGGNYRVLLLKSPKHTEKQVVKAITRVVPNSSRDHALSCYATSLSLGMAIVCSVMKEYAEMYSLQLYGMGLKTAIEPDTSVA